MRFMPKSDSCQLLSKLSAVVKDKEKDFLSQTACQNKLECLSLTVWLDLNHVEVTLRLGTWPGLKTGTNIPTYLEH
jgi:hypothetical protein